MLASNDTEASQGPRSEDEEQLTVVRLQAQRDGAQGAKKGQRSPTQGFCPSQPQYFHLAFLTGLSASTDLQV